MLQRGGLLPGVTVAELVGMVRGLYPRSLPRDEILTQAGLTAIARRRIEQLSGGQAQRVRFALAIAGDPELLFLDEPTVAMDVEARQAFWSGIRAFAAAGRTVLFATHYLEEADAVADRIIVLQRGRVVSSGSAAALKSRVALRQVRLTLPGADLAAMRALPGVHDAETHGEVVTLRTTDTDATVRALYTGGYPLRDLEVTGAGLEEAFLTLTGQGGDGQASG
jgi:ABC-2 type transport system ATP-binding protein